jgi:hypothetical protein
VGTSGALVLQAANLSADQLQQPYDAIDRDVTRAMLHAEKQAKRPAGKYSWSPKLREVGLLTLYWHLRQVEQQSSFQVALTRFMKQFKTLNIVFDALPTCTDATVLKQKWESAVKLLRTVQDKAYDHRAVHLKATLQYYMDRTFAEDESGAEENKQK